MRAIGAGCCVLSMSSESSLLMVVIDGDSNSVSESRGGLSTGLTIDLRFSGGGRAKPSELALAFEVALAFAVALPPLPPLRALGLFFIA